MPQDAVKQIDATPRKATWTKRPSEPADTKSAAETPKKPAIKMNALTEALGKSLTTKVNKMLKIE